MLEETSKVPRVARRFPQCRVCHLDAGSGVTCLVDDLVLVQRAAQPGSDLVQQLR